MTRRYCNWCEWFVDVPEHFAPCPQCGRKPGNSGEVPFPLIVAFFLFDFFLLFHLGWWANRNGLSLVQIFLEVIGL